MEEDLQFEFEWIVEGVSTFMKSNECKWSPTFNGPSSQYSWQLTMGPESLNEGKEKNAFGLYLYPRGVLPKTHKLRARFQLSLRDKQGTLGNQRGGPDEEIDFSKKLNWGFPTFIRHAALTATDCRWLNDDKLTVHCILWIDAEVSLRANIGQCVEDLGLMFLNADFADATLVTNTKTFPVHKVILAARSKVFAAMFKSPMVEGTSGSVEIPDFDDDTVEGMLKFIYTGQVANLKDHAQALLQIGDKYDLQGLKTMAEDSLVKSLTVANVTDALLVADLVNATLLKSKAKEFVSRNKQEVIKSEAFQRLGQSNPLVQMLMELYLASEK